MEVYVSLGHDIMEAVRRGGSENWMPRCEKNQKEKSKKPKSPAFEEQLTAVKKALGNGRWTISDLSRDSGINQEALRHRLDKLMKLGTVKRGTKAPYVYWLLNT